MTLFTKTILAAGLVSAFLAAPALADEKRLCSDVPRDQWMSVNDVTAKIQARGYTVRGVESDHGCWEVDVQDKDGRRAELKVHPVTAEVVQTDPDDDDD